MHQPSCRMNDNEYQAVPAMHSELPLPDTPGPAAAATPDAPETTVVPDSLPPDFRAPSCQDVFRGSAPPAHHQETALVHTASASSKDAVEVPPRARCPVAPIPCRVPGGIRGFREVGTGAVEDQGGAAVAGADRPGRQAVDSRCAIDDEIAPGIVKLTGHTIASSPDGSAVRAVKCSRSVRGRDAGKQARERAVVAGEMDRGMGRLGGCEPGGGTA